VNNSEHPEWYPCAKMSQAHSSEMAQSGQSVCGESTCTSPPLFPLGPVSYQYSIIHRNPNTDLESDRVMLGIMPLPRAETHFAGVSMDSSSIGTLLLCSDLTLAWPVFTHRYTYDVLLTCPPPKLRIAKWSKSCTICLIALIPCH